MEEELEGMVLVPEKGKETAVEYLRRLANGGYGFHGSRSRGIGVLELRKASDPSNEWNSDTAVYVSGRPDYSIIFSLRPNRAGSWTLEKDGEGNLLARMPKSWRREVERGQGCVYLVSLEGMEKDSESGGNQYKSKLPVKVLGKVEVKLSDFEEFGGRVEWV